MRYHDWLNFFAEPPVDRQLVAAPPQTLDWTAKLLVLDAPVTEPEESLVARGPSEFLPFVQPDATRPQNNWKSPAAAKLSVGRINAVIHCAQHLAKNLRVRS